MVLSGKYKRADSFVNHDEYMAENGRGRVFKWT
jgi:hypothetical protein